jgi:hypothetical protein
VFFIVNFLVFRIDLAQLQLTETILLLEVYLSISNSAIPVQKKTGGKAAAEKLLETMTSR